MSEQFENNIRKKLQEAEIPFDPAAWDQMQKRLDDPDRRRPAFWWWAGGLLLLLGVGGWWFFEQKAVDENRIERIVVSDRPDSSNPIPASADNPPTGATPRAPKNERMPITENASGTNTEQPGKTFSGKNTSNAQFVTNPRATDGVDKVPGNRKGETGMSPAIGAGQPIKENTVTGVDKSGLPAADKVNNSSTVNQTPKTTIVNSSNPAANVDKPATPVSPLYPEKPVYQSPDTAGTPLAVDNPEKPQKKKQKRGFDAGITMAVDYNTVPSLKNGRIGIGGGLLVRYHINNNFHISTGAAYTKKLYGAEDKDYNTPYPTYYKKIDADCDVLDVPLNLHYTFLHRPKGSWGVMAGASSYFMLKEKYEYYTVNGGKYTRTYNGDNQHYFSILNLGVNYERETGGRIRWGVQPFVKLPMGGVGQGKVKLVSAGVSLLVTVGKKP